MKRQVSQRLGSGSNDAVPIKSHQFFKLVNWEDVLARRLEPPIKPLLVSSINVTIVYDNAFDWIRLFFYSEVKTMYHSSTQNSHDKYQSIHPSSPHSAKVWIQYFKYDITNTRWQSTEDSANFVVSFQGFTYVAPSVLEEMQKPRIVTARSPRRSRRINSRNTPPHLQQFAPRPSPQDTEIMDVTGVPIV